MPIYESREGTARIRIFLPEQESEICPFLPRQIHGARVHHVVDSEGPIPEADAVWTDRTDIWIGVKTADCIPLLFWNNHGVGAVHAGWRGLVAGVIPSFLRAVENREGLRVLIGPCIGSCCYEVGDDVAHHFPSFMKGPFLDLRACAVQQLIESGIGADGITHLPWCTQCSVRKLPSYRREGENASRIISAIVQLP
ncbi:MAG TPA: polyphenol oxidase family protein [Thermoanaerobaculia bacterium]|nr:polyphenol oxidase family protein [Thermoanaerobaculia bacterium]HUM30301.1 polyphenol oxidase family protein [Thermoanaerobaculia bacterium]HXK68548.1 polyphenol oxidase family protein [Thermoanaerobaculia bacterium]